MKITDIMPLCSALVYVPEVVAAISSSKRMYDIAQMNSVHGDCRDTYECRECPLHRYLGCVPGYRGGKTFLDAATAAFLTYALEIYHAHKGAATTDTSGACSEK